MFVISLYYVTTANDRLKTLLHFKMCEQLVTTGKSHVAVFVEKITGCIKTKAEDE